MTVAFVPSVPGSRLGDFAPSTAETLRTELAGFLHEHQDDVLVASSRFAADAAGVDAVVASPPVAVDHLHDAVPSAPTQHHLRRLGSQPVVFLALGAILPDAHIDMLLAANNVLTTVTLPDAQLIVAGPAPLPRYLEVCEFYSREMNTDHTWLATTPTLGEYAAFLRMATAVVHLDTSSRYPREVFEAMSFGVPVIGREHSVLHELAPDAGIFLAANDGALVLAEAMAELAANTALRTTLGHQARRVATLFSSDDAHAHYERRLQELAS